MKIVKPKVEYWAQGENKFDHIAKCARVCYASDRTTNNEKFVNGLIHNNHLSMLRHWSVYIHIKDCLCGLKHSIIEKYFSIHPYCGFVYAEHADCYISTNLQYFNDVKEELMKIYDFDLEEYVITQEELEKEPWTQDIRRYTMFVQTGIDISRELNRVSPNNIAEQSTRYVEQGSICQSHFYDITLDEVDCDLFGDCYDKDRNIIIPLLTTNDYKPVDINDYLISCADCFRNYNRLLNSGFKEEDARKVLPLATTTKCVYTYSLKEWKHILDLRLYGTTGRPHPDAKIIGELIQKEFHKIGFEV